MNTLQRDAVRKGSVITFHDRATRQVASAIVRRRFRDGRLSIETQYVLDPDNGEEVGAYLGEARELYLSDVDAVRGIYRGSI